MKKSLQILRCLPFPQLLNLPYKFPRDMECTHSAYLLKFLDAVLYLPCDCYQIRASWVKLVSVDLESSFHLLCSNEILTLQAATHRLTGQPVDDFAECPLRTNTMVIVRGWRGSQGTGPFLEMSTVWWSHHYLVWFLRTFLRDWT